MNFHLHAPTLTVKVTTTIRRTLRSIAILLINPLELTLLDYFVVLVDLACCVLLFSFDDAVGFACRVLDVHFRITPRYLCIFHTISKKSWNQIKQVLGPITYYILLISQLSNFLNTLVKQIKCLYCEKAKNNCLFCVGMQLKLLRRDQFNLLLLKDKFSLLFSSIKENSPKDCK